MFLQIHKYISFSVNRIFLGVVISGFLVFGFGVSDVSAQQTCSQAGGSCQADTCSGNLESAQGTCSNPSVPNCCKATTSTGGTSTTPINTVVEFENPLKETTVEGVLFSFLNYLQGIIVTIAILFIVIAGLIYMTSGGSEKRTTLAKGALVAALIGLAIGIAAPSFLKEIYTILEPAGGVPAEVSGATSLSTIVLNTLNFLLSIVGALAIIMMVIGGIMYLFSGGDQNRVDAGKKIVIYSIVGIAVVFAALILVKQIANFFA